MLGSEIALHNTYKIISIGPRLSDESPAEEADTGDTTATAQFSCLLVQLRASLWLWLFPWEGLFQGTAVKLWETQRRETGLSLPLNRAGYPDCSPGLKHS